MASEAAPNVSDLALENVRLAKAAFAALSVAISVSYTLRRVIIQSNLNENEGISKDLETVNRKIEEAYLAFSQIYPERTK